MNEKVEIEYVETNVRGVYGGKCVEIVYLMTHTNHGRVNKYRVTCEIMGIQARVPELVPKSAYFIGDMETESNDETLTEQAVMDLFDEHK